MSWKDDLLELKRQERWMDIIVSCEQQIQKGNVIAERHAPKRTIAPPHRMAQAAVIGAVAVALFLGERTGGNGHIAKQSAFPPCTVSSEIRRPRWR